MGFDLDGLLDATSGDGYGLHAAISTPQLPRVLQAIGFDTAYERADGAYLYDGAGRR